MTGLCYTEFAVEVPIAGSAYNYVAMTFGEFGGFLCGCNLALELTISAAAVARGWTSYVATTIGLSPNALRVPMGALALDIPALCLTALIIALLCVGIKETARFNFIVTVVSLLAVAFVIVAGAFEVKPENWTPFAPGGVSGVLAGASVVFFSFVGFDTVATCAEEVANPGRDLPIGILGSLGVCAVIYALMCVIITGMVPTPNIDVDAPFAVAFAECGKGWAARVISVGAVASITTALLSSLMGQPRVYMVMARDGLLPEWFTKIHPKQGTPINATLFTGFTTGALALLVDIDVLAELVSIGTLAIFCAVCAGLLVRRHTPPDVGSPESSAGAEAAARTPALLRVAALLAAALVFSVSYTSGGGGYAAAVVCVVALGGFIAATLSFLRLERHNHPKQFCTPLVPYLPAFGILATIQLITSLGPLAWARFVVYTLLCSVGYVAYGTFRLMSEPEKIVLELSNVGAGAGGADVDGNEEAEHESSGLLQRGAAAD